MVVQRVVNHYREHQAEFDMDRAESMLAAVIRDPIHVFEGNKANSFLFLGEWSDTHFLAVSVKALPTELWMETMYITRKKRFLRRAANQAGPVYSKE